MNTTFEYHVIEPQGTEQVSDTLGLYAMPIAATIQNSGDRLQAMANEVGIPFIATDLLLQKKKVILDMAAKDANRPSGDVYHAMSRYRNDFFNDVSEQFAPRVKLGMADSLGVSAVQGMQLHGAEEDPTFTHVLLRDGWNLSRPAGTLRGVGRYLGYQAADFAHQTKVKMQGDGLTVPEAGWGDVESRYPDETSFAQKVLNVADLMRGPENRRNAVQLAEQAVFAGTSLNIVGFRHGLSGDLTELRDFIDDIKNEAERAQQLVTNLDGEVKVQVEEGWHSDLLDPMRGARHVAWALNLGNK